MNSDIQRHISQTYINLRVGMAVLAFFLPIALFLGSWFGPDYEWQSSISDYYHTPMRNVLVGALVSIGSFLYLYKGFSKTENTVLNLAGVFALGIAFFPNSQPAALVTLSPKWLPVEPFVFPAAHYSCAVLFFLAIAYVCIYCGDETLELLEDEKLKARYKLLYRLLGILMIAMPIATAFIFYFTARDYLLFLVETAAVWVFATFWLVKSRELRRQTSPVETQLLRSNH